MRSTFSRTFFSAAMVLLMAMLLIGTSFQALVKNYLTEEAMEGLKNDGNAISALASAYYTEGTLNHEDFLVNLSFVSQVSQADAVICDSTGRLVLCSRAPFGCGHQGLSVSPDFLQNMVDLLHGRGHDDNSYTVTQAVGNGHSGHKPLFLI